MIDLSLNEVETLSTKAARGSGFSWGLAEDIGRAARRIAVEDENWALALLSLVETAPSFATPSPARLARWHKGEADIAGEKSLCPIRIAALLLDDPPDVRFMPMTILGVGLPVWLDAMLQGSNLRVAYPAAPATLKADIIIIERRRDIRPPVIGRRGSIDAPTLAALNAFASKTYVPESERSRVRGAGGGRVDDE